MPDPITPGRPCRHVLALLLALVVVLVSGCSTTNPAPLAGRTVYLAPLDDFSGATTQQLVAFYRQKYGLEARVLQAAAVDRAAWDRQRGQLVAEDVITSLKASYAQVVADPGAVVIGLVRTDLYLRERTDWAWAFGLRAEGRFAVVSTARMSWPLGLASDERTMSRLRKMVTKDIGLMYFGLSASDDSHSVLYRNIGGVDDLDGMGEEF